MKPELPSGNVTFLFTDIEGSTKLWESVPEKMKTALLRHNEIMHESIAANSGVVFQIIGDAFCSAFPDAPSAVSAAMQAQRELFREAWDLPSPIRVRMAIHSGNAEPTSENSAIAGYHSNQTLNRVARILSAGHGGQTLISKVTFDSLPADSVKNIIRRDMGVRRLKDLIRPEHVYQIGDAGLPQEFAPLKTLDARPNNLPVQLTSFIGREQELKDVKELLKSSRVLTLTGSGGAGKTRLSLQVGADLIDEFEHGVWFVDLVLLSDAKLIPQAIASGLRVKEEAGCRILDSLAKYVKDKELLIILDSCEHMLQACAEVVKQLTQASVNLKILASSREPMHIAGEQLYRVPSLSAPDPKKKISAEAVLRFESVRLFIDRATSTQPAFRVTNQNLLAIADICHRIDGIPLAVELAAARIRAMTVEKIAERLTDRFSLLTGGDKTALPRQQTLRAMIDWSYDLLSDPERALLRRLSVFSGSWSLEAAETVCSGGIVDTASILDLLTQLVEKSLVVFNAEGERYSMLETLRQYATGKMKDSGEDAVCRDAHSLYYLGLAEKAAAAIAKGEQTKWLNLLHADYDNLRTTLDWLLKTGKIEEALRVEISLGGFWSVEGPWTEAREWFRKTLAVQAKISPVIHTKALRLSGLFAWYQGDNMTAQKYLQDSLAGYRQIGDKAGVATLLNDLGLVAFSQQDYAVAQKLHEDSLEISRELGEIQQMTSVLLNLGNTANAQKNYEKGQKFYEESLAICREFGKNRGMALALFNMGYTELVQDNKVRARSLYEESLSLFRELGEKRGISVLLLNLGHIIKKEGDHAEARKLYEEGISICSELGDKKNIAHALSGLSDILCVEGCGAQAASVQGAATALFQMMGISMDKSEQADSDKTTAALKTMLGDAEYLKAFEAGRTLSLEQAIESTKRA